jgi:uncharacterized protein with gpF-like domain
MYQDFRWGAGGSGFHFYPLYQKIKKSGNMFHKIFEKQSIFWRKAVAKYARLVWTDRLTPETDKEYDTKASYFAREYRYALERHYSEKGMNVYRGTLDGWIKEWQRKQQALKDTLKTIAEDKQGKLVSDALAQLESQEDQKNAQKIIDKLYGAKKNETVYKVFSFKENFEKLAEQKGDDSAYELGTGINEGIIQHFSDRYFWRTQRDKRVRNTHKQLADKCFLFFDPPTTVDKYGNKHTGNPGTDWSCRCFAEIAPEREKVLRNYIVYER